MHDHRKRSSLLNDPVKFAVLGLLWGCSFLLIKYGLTGFSPSQVGLSRLWLGAATLAAVAVLAKRPWPRSPRQHGALVLVSVFMFVIPVNLYSWAGQYIPSSVSSILNATTPIMTVLVSAVAPRVPKPSAPQIAGVIIGACGVLLIFEPWSIGWDLSQSYQLPAMLACLGATTCYAIAYVLMSKLLSAETQRAHDLPPIDAVTGTAEQLACAALIDAALSLATGTWVAGVQWKAQAVIALLVLGVCSTGYGYFLNTQLAQSRGAVWTSQVTYVTPVVGVLLGWWLAQEELSLWQLAGGLVVMAGIWVTRLRSRSLPHPQNRA